MIDDIINAIDNDDLETFSSLVYPEERNDIEVYGMTNYEYEIGFGAYALFRGADDIFLYLVETMSIDPSYIATSYIENYPVTQKGISMLLECNVETYEMLPSLVRYGYCDIAERLINNDLSTYDLRHLSDMARRSGCRNLASRMTDMIKARETYHY